MKKHIQHTILLTVIAAAAILIPTVLVASGVIDEYIAGILSQAGVYAIMAISVNLISGITGQLSLGQAGFMALGAYSTILFNTILHVPLPVSVVLAGIVTALFGFLIGFPTLKLEGDYLAIVTLAFGEIIRVVLVNMKKLTGGPNGKSFNTILTMDSTIAVLTITAVLVLIIVLVQNVIRSSYGRAILAVREDEIAANSCGIPVFRYKMTGFVLASFVAGIGGSLYVMLIGFIKPEQAAFTKSIDYLIFVVLGGMGSMTGSVLAAYVLTFLQESLRFLQNYRLLFYPVVLILVMLFRPQGLLGTKEFSFVNAFEWIKSGGLKTSDISIVFGGLCAVSDASFDLYEGELIGLIGPNGAGKTTMFNMVSGIYTPTSGQLSYWDRENKVRVINKANPAQLNKLGIARTFQNIRLFGNLTVLDNVRIALHNSRISNPLDVLFRTSRFRRDEQIMTEKVMQLLSLFKIDGKCRELAKNLPYGEQRKLEIVRALASNPKLLLLDEPAAGMNPQETHELMEMIAFIRREFNLTILLIEHDMKLVMGICERIMVLNYGKIIASGTPEEIKSNPQVIKAYLGGE